MRRWYLWLLCLVLLAGCGAVEVPAEEAAPVPMDWREAYKTFLTDLCRHETAVRDGDTAAPDTYGETFADPSECYCLYDIDKDGTPELFVRYGNCSADEHARVYTFSEGEVVQAGDVPVGNSCLYTWPGENAVVLDRGHMNWHAVEKLSLMGGILTQETIFEKRDEDPWENDRKVTDLVPGCEVIRSSRTTLGRNYGEPGNTGREVPLLLPVDEYGMDRTRRELDKVRSETARTAIRAVLDGEKPLFGVSADGFGGDTGEVLLTNYLAVVDRYAKEPQRIRKLAWLDMNGDGQTECLLCLRGGEGRSAQYVVLAEEDSAVYAYCENYVDCCTVDVNGVFRPMYDGDAFALSFAGEQCYQYSVSYDGAVPEAVWENIT